MFLVYLGKETAAKLQRLELDVKRVQPRGHIELLSSLHRGAISA